MKFASYWHDTSVPFDGAMAGPVSGDFEVAVIGAGFTGLNAARTLAKSGVKVALIEAEHVGYGASGRNGGHLNSGHFASFGAAKAHFRDAQERRLWRAYDDFMFREILPNAMGPIIVAATLTVAHAILLEAYISFLGYGIQPPLPNWGNMLEGAQQYLASAPWLAIIPAAAITIAVTSFNFIGDGLRDELDVRDDSV